MGFSRIDDLLNYASMEQDYDYEGQSMGDNGHWGDAGKLPNHMTFSTESGHGGKYLGGRWVYPDDASWRYDSREPMFVPSGFNLMMQEERYDTNPWDVYAGYSDATGEKVLMPQFDEGGKTKEVEYRRYNPKESEIIDFENIPIANNGFEVSGGPSWLKEFARKIVDSEARNAPSYEDVEFGTAFRDARKNGANTFYWNGQYFNTNLDKNPFADTAVNYKYTDWTKQMFGDLRDMINQSNISFSLDDIAKVIEEESSYNKFSSNGSYVGPMQFGIDWLTKIYGDDARSVYNQYKNKTRTDDDIVLDIVNYLQKLDDNIKTERDNMSYGRLKVNQYAPNSSLDSKVSNLVWNNNLKKEIKLGRLSNNIKPGVSTYRDVMKSYDELLQKRNK